MTTLALDLGQYMGWMKGNAVGPLEWGTHPLQNTTDLHLWLKSADSFLVNITKGVDQIVVEQPFLGESYYPARKLLAMLGHVYYYAGFNGIPQSRIHEVPIASGKLALSGYGKAEAPQMIEACCDWYGMEPEEIDEHIAHAGGILKFHFFGSGPPKRKKARSGPGRSVLQGEKS